LSGSLKTLIGSENCSESRFKQISVPAFLCSHWSIFSVYIHSRHLEQFSGSQAGYGTTFRDTGGYQKAGTSSLKRVTVGISQLVSDFVEASRNFNLDFLHKKTT
jgi:hypothetical protein